MDEPGEAPFTASLPSHPSNLSDMRIVNTDNPCFLTNLATELVHRIVDYIPPASHINFACTCKHLAACSADAFKRHREAQLKYGVSSDIDPTTIPTLLRSAFGYGDPILAWHVRSLEVWFDRRGWETWKTLDFEIPVNQSTQSPIAWEFMPGEVDDYLERLEQGQGSLRPERIDEARTQILDGHDTYLKALFITNCPRLRDVKFVAPARYDGFRVNSCLGWIDTFINDSYNNKTSWGPGLQNLQSAAVGLPSGTWMDDAYHSNTEPFNLGILMQFLRLPRLEKIYFKDGEGGTDDETPWDVLNPAGSSSIKHLFLDNCGEVRSHRFIEALTAAPSALETASFRAGTALLEHADSFVSDLGFHQGQSLESLMFYDYHDSPGSIHGYRCAAFLPEALNNFRNLKHISMDIADIELDASGNSREEWESDGAYLERWFLETVKHYEVLVLWGSLGNFFTQWEPTEEQGFEDAVMSVLNNAEMCMNAIYLENVEKSSGPISTLGGRPLPNQKDKIWFRRAIEVARKRGVDLHTLTNRNKPRHQIEFPEAPDKYDLKTGPWGERPEDWVFNVYTGRREPKGCGRCGNCDVCLGYYSKEMWDGLENEPRRVRYDGQNEDGTEDD